MNRLTRIIIALVLFGFGVNALLYRAITPLWISVFLGLYLLFILVSARRIHKMVWVFVFTAVLSTIFLMTRTTTVVVFINILMVVASVGYVWYITLMDEPLFGTLTNVLFTPVFAALTYIRSLFSLVTQGVFRNLYELLVKELSQTKSHSKAVSTLIGIAITIPVLTILIGFFASADPIYYSFVQKIFSKQFLGQLPWRILLTLLLCITSLPLILPQIRRVYFSPGQVLYRLRLSRELTIVMAGVSLVLASFIVVQWNYIFVSVVSETSLSQFGVATYAEYVTKGFIELLRVSAFIYILIWLGLSALRNTEFKSKWLFYFQMIVLGEFLVILLSIFRRVYLYQAYHGLSLIRVYGTFFLVFLTGLTLTLAARHLLRKVRMSYVEGAFILVLFISIGIFNAESFIARKDPPTVNKQVDYTYLARLSPDGVDGWVDAYRYVDFTLTQYDQTSGTLDRTARRDIALSGKILENLTTHYEDLTLNHGSDSEFKEYVHEIVSFQKTQVTEYIRELTEYKLKRDVDTSWVDSTITSQQTLIRLLDEFEDSLTQKEVTHFDNFCDVRTSSGMQELSNFDPKSPNMNSFYYSYEYFYDKHNPGYSPATIVDDRKSYTALDRGYLYNASARRALGKIQTEIPLKRLLELQQLYFKLGKRIGLQAERDYTIDISFDTPLL